MPKARICEHAEDGRGNVVYTKTRVVSDEELAIEALEQETAEINSKAIYAYQNWGKLDQAGKNTVLKGLLGYFISNT